MPNHLTLTMCLAAEIPTVLDDLCLCQQLQSLCLISASAPLPRTGPVLELPDCDLSPATKLQHVELRGILPKTESLLSLPAGCALRLDGFSNMVERLAMLGIAKRELVDRFVCASHC